MKQILIAIIVVLLCIIGYLLFFNKPANKTNNNNMDNQTSTEPKDPILSLGWSLYKNSDLGFKLGIPNNISIDKELNTDANKLVTFKGGNNLEVRLKTAGSMTIDQYRYLDFNSSGTGSLSGEKASIFKALKGYCDGPDCTQPFIAYSARHGDYFYNVVFYGDTTLNQIEQGIVNSFTFTN